MNHPSEILTANLTEALVWAHLGRTHGLGDWAGRTAHGLIGETLPPGLDRDAATFLIARLLHLAADSGLRLPVNGIGMDILEKKKARGEQRGDREEEPTILSQSDLKKAEDRARAALEYLNTWVDGATRARALGPLCHVTVDEKITPPEDRPIIEWGTHLYLHRTWWAERAFLKAIAPFAPGDTVTLLAKEARALAEAIKSGDGKFALHPMQEKAASLAGASRLVLLTGGPGTGKTTTVVQVLRLLLEKDPDARIALGAPTGRAAVRLAEAVRGELSSHPWPNHGKVDEKLGRLTGATLHSLIGMNPLGSPRHDPSNPMPYDFVVADEATMADLSLLTALLDALHPGARLMLVGDPAQLPSVDTGSVFADLLPGADGKGVFKDVTVVLTENKRSSNCKILSAMARRMADPTGSLLPLGDSDADKALKEGMKLLDEKDLLPKATAIPTVKAILEQLAAEKAQVGKEKATKAFADLLWVDTDWGHLSPIWDAWYPWDELAAAAAGKSAKGAGPATAEACENELSDIHQNHVILVPGHNGPWGTVALNQAMRRRLIEKLRPHHMTTPLDPAGYVPGEPILMPSSRRDLELQNGDRGVVVDRGGKLVALFPGVKDDPGAARFRQVELDQIPEARPAWALTIHKSQGSEFRRVALLIPSSAVRLISRELAYTGITRTKECCLLVCTKETWEMARRHVVIRDSGIKDWAQASP